MQQEQIKEQLKLINLTRVEMVKNWKMLRQSDCMLLQSNASFTALFREMIMLTYDKNFTLTMLHLKEKIAIFQDCLTQIQYTNLYAYIKTLSTSKINLIDKTTRFVISSI